MEQSDERFCVYTHTRPDTGKIFYVGIGVKRRPYIRDGRNNLWKKIVAKNNGEFIVSIIGENLSWEFCCAVEIGLIKTYGRINNKTGILCNMTDGGEGAVGYILSEEARKKISVASTGRAKSAETLSRMSKSLKGKNTGPKSDEHKAKLSEARRKRPPASQETRDKIRAATLGMVKTEAAIVRRSISNSINRGYVIQQSTLVSGIVVHVYLNCNEAAKGIGASFSANIPTVLKGKRKIAGGYKWSKLHDMTKVYELLIEKYPIYQTYIDSKFHEPIKRVG